MAIESLFTNPLDVEYTDGDHWKLLTTFDYLSPRFGVHIVVPGGFLTDFASIPKAFWNILPPTGIYGKAACVHDYLYQTGGMAGKFTRADCDLIFRDAMRELGTSWLTRMTMYAAVRQFGGEFYRKVQPGK